MERRNFDSHRGHYNGHRSGGYGGNRDHNGRRDHGNQSHREQGGHGGYHNHDRERNDHRFGGGNHGHHNGNRDRSDRFNDRGPRPGQKRFNHQRDAGSGGMADHRDFQSRGGGIRQFGGRPQQSLVSMSQSSDEARSKKVSVITNQFRMVIGTNAP